MLIGNTITMPSKKVRDNYFVDIVYPYMIIQWYEIIKRFSVDMICNEEFNYIIKVYIG